MATITFPTGSDISIEVNGQRLAVAQSYKARTAKESRYVEAFGSREPVGAVDGRVKHLLELTRVCVTGAALRARVDFYARSPLKAGRAPPAAGGKARPQAREKPPSPRRDRPPGEQRGRGRPPAPARCPGGQRKGPPGRFRGRCPKAPRGGGKKAAGGRRPALRFPPSPRGRRWCWRGLRRTGPGSFPSCCGCSGGCGPPPGSTGRRWSRWEIGALPFLTGQKSKKRR